MNRDKYSADDLDRRITIQKMVSVSDGGGGRTQSLQTIKTVWAKVISSYRDERFMGNQIQTIQPYKVVIMYLPAVDVTCQILYGTKKLKIGSIADVNEERRWLELSCEETR